MTSNPTGEFFAELGSRASEPLLGKAKGTARFDVVDDKRTARWLLAIDRGAIEVSRRNAAADCVVRADRAIFDRIVAGELNFMAAVLRGEVALQGDPRLVVLLQRLFPRPSGRRPQRGATSAPRRAE